MKGLYLVLLLAMCGLAFGVPSGAQGTSGGITGTVVDSNQGALPGAKILLEPTNVLASSDNQGKFALNGIAPGTYHLTVSYVGFSAATDSITVVAGQTSNATVVLRVASQSQEIVVTATQARGETEAINQERTSSNILDVLPAKLITSLPNANIADAVGRLPSVTLERDEGEGKYVQIRGTEPRLSNLTIDGVGVPSPEGGVRQVKLDTIPADLVQSVQIYKTLEADQPGDAIGGSVNLETKKAGDQPTLSFYGLGGFTPIINTVPVSEAGATAGKRFGAQKRLGVLVSGEFDYNGRGIDDIEPLPALQAGPAYFSTMDLRQYYYDRKRYGFGGTADYKLGSASTIFLRGLFSDFKDFGHRFDYAIQDQSAGFVAPTLTTERRLGDYQVADAILGGDHTAGKWTLHWEGSVARARMLNPINGGESVTTFTYAPTSSNCMYDPAATKNPYLPQFTPACFTEAYNPANFALSSIADSAHGLSAQLNLQGSASVIRSYFLGSHPGLFQFGAAVRNAHKFDDSYENDYTPNGTVLMSQFVTNFHNPNYYGGAYQFGPGISWEAVNAYRAANPSAFAFSTTAGGNSNNFDLIERISSGYLMNTLDIGRFTLITGVRFEGTQDNTLSYDGVANFCLCVKGTNSYFDVLPSASLEIGLDNNSDIRLAYGRGISRPDPQFLTAATNFDSSTVPATITYGNPALTPEHANDYDVLYERFLNPVGAVRAGFFYKSITDPIVNLRTGPLSSALCTSQGFSTCFQTQATNAGSAYISGIELSFEQHFTYLPGVLRGLGVFANYSYTTSQATKVDPGFRIDDPALLRQAPNTWNVFPTYDRGRVSVGVGLSYNSANIFQYAYTACQSGQTVNAGGSCNVNPLDAGNPTPQPTPGGITGPGGDVYLFAHLEVDAQGSIRLGKGVTFLAQALNLNNEVFGFYQGSPQYFIQREYYKPTYSFGFRWDLGER